MLFRGIGILACNNKPTHCEVLFPFVPNSDQMCLFVIFATSRAVVVEKGVVIGCVCSSTAGITNYFIITKTCSFRKLSFLRAEQQQRKSNLDLLLWFDHQRSLISSCRVYIFFQPLVTFPRTFPQKSTYVLLSNFSSCTHGCIFQLPGCGEGYT